MSSFPSGTALAILAMRDAIMISTESWQTIPSFSVGRTFGNGGFSWIYVGFVGAVQEIFSLLCSFPLALEPMSQIGTRCHPVCHTINRSGIVAEVRSGNMSLAAKVAEQNLYFYLSPNRCIVHLKLPCATGVWRSKT